jgi:hypothetical protein
MGCTADRFSDATQSGPGLQSARPRHRCATAEGAGIVVTTISFDTVVLSTPGVISRAHPEWIRFGVSLARARSAGRTSPRRGGPLRPIPAIRRRSAGQALQAHVRDRRRDPAPAWCPRQGRCQRRRAHHGHGVAYADLGDVARRGPGCRSELSGCLFTDPGRGLSGQQLDRAVRTAPRRRLLAGRPVPACVATGRGRIS